MIEKALEPKTGGTILVLGGGGARGFAHFGVLKVLEDAGVQIDRIVGVSIGAFVGALYCHQPDTAAITARVAEYVASERFSRFYGRMTKASKNTGNRNGETADIETETARLGLLGRLKDYLRATMAFHRFVVKPGILSNRPMLDCLEYCMPESQIEDLEIPLSIVAADLKSGDRVLLESGDLFSAVVGTTALPGIFPPVARGDHLLSDYGVLCSMPVTTAMQFSPDRIIAVDLTPEIEFKETFSSGLEVVNRMESIGCFLFKERSATFADTVIKPDVGHVDWADFHDMEAVIEKGMAATKTVLPELTAIKNTKPSGLIPNPGRQA